MGRKKRIPKASSSEKAEEDDEKKARRRRQAIPVAMFSWMNSIPLSANEKRDSSNLIAWDV